MYLSQCGLLYLPSFLDVPTYTASRLSHPHSAGTMRARNGRLILSTRQLPRNVLGSFTCRKSKTWDPRFYFPSEGRRGEDFFALKNPTASSGFEPSNFGTKASALNPRPPKALASIFACKVVDQLREIN
jgi:hypothetical protein